MDFLVKVPFNRKPSSVMHIDLNACFASVEQQANPRLRGQPIAVAAYTTPSGCIVAPYGRLSWLDAGFLAVNFIITYAILFALVQLMFGPVKPEPREDTSDDDVSSGG